MPIYKNGQAIKAFKGDYKPVNIYKGNIRITGWEFANVSGETLYVNDTYNDTAYLAILGKTIETGIGEKSPYNPYVFQSVENFDITSTNGDKLSMVTFNYNLRSLPDGTCDYIEIDNVAKTAKLVQAVKRFILSPNENWAISSQDDNRTRFYFYRDLGVLGSVYNSQRCTHFQPFTSYADMSGRVRDGILFESSYFNNLVVSNNIASNVAELKTWLANNSVEINFKTTPTVTYLDYLEIATYYPQTTIYTNATVQPILEGKFRIIES